MHFPRPEVRIYPRKQKPKNQTEKQENGAEAQTQTTTQQLPPVGKQLPPTDPILGPENLLQTGFAQKGLPSCPSGRHKPQSFIETKTLRFCNLDTTNFKK